ncbi:YjjG family noncanonical pyrimidine nucleotidase [Xanthomarina sp. F2636L]|uniref:YjjG family noncanonical pyrimidine nucleotidase n=1 Tax=Xanthomarina sp. F2636L TaxID=2996018 RepID=UPI00225DD06E|nr:YjjG family noncanonical pyrimidine nucleotidase [Xanthomarina sp. F2636L]MCX7550726.1 YjjG family noncanonical pyrimidine nucleotidase [Xanthomarina sp. F2636L]
MKIKGIKDVFFDLDHTLWDFDKNSALTFNKIFKMHDVAIDIDEFLSHYERINLDYWKLYREEKIDKESLRYNRLNDTFNKISFQADRTLINRLSIDYITYLSSFNHLFDYTLDILNYLKPKYHLHIITNGFKEAQESKLRNSNIHHFFKSVTDSEQAGVKKPNPIIFNHALNKVDANPKTSIMIGDNMEADILGALNIGMEAIYFNYLKTFAESKIRQINNLEELKLFL